MRPEYWHPPIEPSPAEAWVMQRNANQATGNWLFTVDDARTKLARLYPHPKLS